MKFCTCDFCKQGPVEVESSNADLPENWHIIRVTVNYGTAVKFDVCEECAIKLKIPELKGPTDADALYDIIHGIVQEAMEP
jgi:hypothetical protein